MDRARRDTFLLAAVLVLAVVGYAVAWSASPATDGDSAGYVEVATDLSDGRLDRLYWRPIGYPLLLLATGSVPVPGRALVVTQLVLHAVAVWLCAGLLRRLGAGRGPSAAFVVVAVLPPFVEHAAFVLSESLTQFCVVVGLVGFARFLLGGRAAWLAAAALSLGVCGIVHPSQGLTWLLLPVLALAWRVGVPAGPYPARRALLGGAAVAGVALSVLGSTMAYNARHFGYAGISPMLGVTLSHKTTRVLERLPPEYDDVREILIRHRDAALLDPATGHLGLAYIFRALPELEARTGLHGPALSRYLVRMNLALIRRAPMDYADEVLRSALWFWAPGVTDLSGFGSPALKAFWNAVRAVSLAAFVASLALLSGPALLALWSLRARGTLPGTSTEGRLLEPLCVLWLFTGTIAFTCLVSISLTAAVYRLRIPVDLPILVCIALFPSLWRALRAALLGSSASRDRPMAQVRAV